MKKAPEDNEEPLKDNEGKEQKEPGLTLAAVEGHEKEVLDKYLKTKDPECSRLLAEHLSKKSINDFKSLKQDFFSRLIAAKEDKEAVSFILSILSEKVGICTPDEIKKLLSPDLVLDLPEKDLNAVVAMLRRVLSAKNEQAKITKKDEALINSSLGLLAQASQKELPLPLWDLLCDVAELYQSKFNARAPTLALLASRALNGDVLERALKILQQASDNFKDKDLINAYAKHKTSESFVNFFLSTCDCVIRETNDNDNRLNSFTQAVSDVVLYKICASKAIAILAAAFKKSMKPNSKDAHTHALSAVEAFIADNKDPSALATALTVVRGTITKGSFALLGATRKRITDAVLADGTALASEPVTLLLCYILQKEVLWRALDDSEIKRLAILAARDGVDTKLFPAIVGVAANAVRGGHTPAAVLDSFVWDTLIKRIAEASANGPMKSHELLADFFVLAKNVLISATTTTGASLTPEKEKLIETVLTVHAPCVYKAFTTKFLPPVKELVKLFLETTLLLLRVGAADKDMPPALCWTLFVTFKESNETKDLSALIAQIYLVATSKSSAYRASLATRETNVLIKFFGDINTASERPANMTPSDRKKVAMIFGVFCNVLCYNIPEKVLDVKSVAIATLRILEYVSNLGKGEDVLDVLDESLATTGAMLIWRIASIKGMRKFISSDKKLFGTFVGLMPYKKAVPILVNTLMFMDYKTMVGSATKDHVKKLFDIGKRTPNDNIENAERIKELVENIRVSPYFKKLLP